MAHEQGETLDDTSTRATRRARPPQPGLVLVWSEHHPECRAVPLEGTELTLGREARAGAFALSGGLVSRTHCRVRRVRGAWEIEDLESRNGTFVDGRRIRGRVRVEEPRALRIGHALFVPAHDVTPARRGVTVDRGVVVGPTLRAVWERLEAYARVSATLLITGESGTGKELAARRFHERGPHADGPFISVNCSAVPEGVAERLLFGATRGAYSGARDATGYLEAADGGTLFLDELGELQLAVQSKLLRVLETHEVLPLGAVRPRPVNIRICMATHRELQSAVAETQFREDLYYRVSQPRVRLPALRERPVEIPWLVHNAIVSAVEASHATSRAHALLVEGCMTREWPGNARELLRALKAATQRAILSGRDVVELDDLDPEVGHRLEPSTRSAAGLSAPDVERALARAGGNVSQAARDLNVHRNQLRRWLARAAKTKRE